MRISYRRNIGETDNKYEKTFNNKSVFSVPFLNFQLFEKLYESSLLFSFFSKLKSKLSFINSFKQKISQMTETSLIGNHICFMCKKLLSVPLRSYGIVLFFFGIFNLIFNFLEVLESGYFENNGIVHVIINDFVVLVMAGILSTSHKGLGESLANSRIVSYFMFNILNFSKKNIEREVHKDFNNTIAGFIGAFAGIISGIIMPEYLFFALFLGIFLVTVMQNPEAGIIFTFFILPFCYEKLLFICVSICIISVFLKILRNKRVMKFSVADVFVFLLSLLILICGFNGISYVDSFGNSVRLVLLILFGWFVNNTIKTSSLSEKCVNALMISSCIVSLVGVLYFILNFIFSYYDNFLFNTLNNILNESSLLSFDKCIEIIVLSIPFSFSKYRSSRGFGFVAAFSALVFVLLSQNVSMLISAIFASVLYFCVISPVLFVYFGIVTIMLTVLNFLFPSLFSIVFNLLATVSNNGIAELSVDLSNNLGISISREFMFSGAGAGSGVFDHILSCFSRSEFLDFIESCPMFTRIILQYGIISIVFICIIYFIFALNCTEIFYNSSLRTKNLGYFTASCLTSVSLIVFKGILFPSLLSVSAVLAVILIFYLSFSIRKSYVIEYVPEAHEFEFTD